MIISFLILLITISNINLLTYRYYNSFKSMSTRCVPEFATQNTMAR